MNNLKLLSLFFISLFIISTLKAQEKTRIKNEIEYELLFEFTGEVGPGFDSTFIVYCVFDKKDIKNVAKLNIESGKKFSKLDKRAIEITDFERVKERDNKVFIEIGRAGENLETIEVETENQQGERSKAKRKIPKS